MKPLVRASAARPSLTASAVVSFVVAGLFAILAVALLFSGEFFFGSLGAVIAAICVWQVLRWTRRWRLESGAAPVLVGAVSANGVRLTSRMGTVDTASRHWSPKSVTIPPGAPVWLCEERPEPFSNVLAEVQPHRYWLIGAKAGFAFGSYGRLTRGDLRDLEAMLAQNGSALHMLFERTPADGPTRLEPVAPGSARTVTLGLPGDQVILGGYSDRRDPGWVPADTAITSGLTLRFEGHLPVIMTFALDGPEAPGWKPQPGLRLPAYADTIALWTRSGIPQAVAQTPQGFSRADVYRQEGPTGTHFYVHLDGAAPAAA